MRDGHGSGPAVQRRQLRAELRTGQPDAPPGADLWDSGPDTVSSVLPTTLRSFMAFESAASAIRNFQPLMVPGLLQTEEHARAVLVEMRDGLTADQVEALVDVRMRRQKLLDKTNPPSLHFVLDEAVVRREIGGPSVTRRQVGKLIEVAGKPNVTIELVPYGAGAHTGLRGPFVILELAGHRDVLYLERLGGCLISQDMAERTMAYRQLFERLRRISLDPVRTVAFLRHIASL